MRHEPLDTNGGNNLSIPDNIQTLWARLEHTQQAVEDRDHHVHSLNTQLNEILQALTALQRSHQLLQDAVRLNNQEVDEEIATLRSQLDFLRGERHSTPTLSAIFATADPNQQSPPILASPTPQVATIPNPIVSNTSEPNLKPAKPDAWDGTERDAKPFRNRVLNYLGSFSGTALSKQVVFVLSLTTHAKSQSWTNTRQDWLANSPARLPPTIPELLEDFVREFGDRNAAVSAQHWIDTTFQGRRTVAQFNNDWLAKVDEAGYTDTLPLVSRYLGHLNKTVQDAILALDTMPSGLDAMMSAALDREAHLIRKAGLMPVMRSFQGFSTPQRPTSSTPTNNPSTHPSTTPTGTTSRFGNLASLAPPKIPKELTDADLIAVMTKPFTSTKGNDSLRAKMLSNKVCLVCRWHKSHATGCPRGTGHARGTDTTTSHQTAFVEEVKEEEGTDFLHGGL